MSDDTDSYLGNSWEWKEQWSQFFQDCNWYTFHPVKIEIERDDILGGIEATVILMGLGFRWRWNYAVTDELRSLRKQVSDLETKYPAD